MTFHEKFSFYSNQILMSFESYNYSKLFSIAVADSLLIILSVTKRIAARLLLQAIVLLLQLDNLLSGFGQLSL